MSRITILKCGEVVLVIVQRFFAERNRLTVRIARLRVSGHALYAPDDLTSAFRQIDSLSAFSILQAIGHRILFCSVGWLYAGHSDGFCIREKL